MKTIINLVDEDVNKEDFWAQDSKSGKIYHIVEGDGSNLFQEDIEAGYVDYIYYDVYEDIQAVNDTLESDGGTILLKQYYKDLSVEEIVKQVNDFEKINLIVEER